MQDWQSALDTLYLEFKDLNEGKVADYIPELAKVDPNFFGLAVVTVDGQLFTAGDCHETFTIQSVSKPFIYGMALEDYGRETVLRKVGVEPTGERFNAIIELDHRSKRPLNPMVNAGAMATSSLIKGDTPSHRFNRLLEAFAKYTGRPMNADMAVFLSERSSGHRNRAIAHLLLNFEMVEPKVEEMLDLYFQQCSLEVNAQDLACMAATLANQGVNPLTEERALSSEYIKDLLSVMLTCGLYDFAGEWAYRVGLPAKSGVGGGMIAVSPGQAGIGIFSPLLDEQGTPVRAVRVCEALSERFGLHIFAPPSPSPSREATSELPAVPTELNYPKA